MFALKIYDVSGKCLSKLTQSPPDVGRKMNMSARYLVIVFFFPSKTERDASEWPHFVDEVSG